MNKEQTTQTTPLGETDKFKIPDEKLALFDIDKTLVDVSYDVTDEGIYAAMERAQGEGWVIGLSSDTPYAKLAGERTRFGVNGPLIAERGAVVEWGGEIHYDTDMSEEFTSACGKVEETLLERGFHVTRSYPAEFTTFGAEKYKTDDPIFFINPSRLCSIGIWARRLGQDRELVLDDKLTNEMAGLVRPYMPDTELFWDLNPDYGILISAPNSVDKRVGTKHFLSLAGVTGSIAMVGDSISDFLGDIAHHYAVGNASLEFKSKADYVASAPLTSGAIEIIDKLRTEKYTQ